MNAPTAIIVAMGEEILEGRVVDLNSSELARRLLQLGFDLHGMRTIGDGTGELRELLGELRGKVDVIVTSGGLGPTPDDRARSEVSAFLDAPLEEVPGAVEPLTRAYLRARSEEPPKYFLAQGFVPRGATPMANPAGAAWGFHADLGAGTRVYVLPGPPHECRSCFLQGGAAADLAGRHPHAEGQAFGVFHAAGVPESAIEADIRDLLESEGNPRLGITAGPEAVSVSVLARPERGTPAAEVLERTGRTLRERLGAHYWGRDEESLSGVVLALLRERGETVALAESCTGGRIAAALTAVPGSSDVFGSGWVSYADAAKERELGVPAALLAQHGAVSEEVALAMARGARERAGADWGIGVTGIAGPSGGSEDRPVGLVWIALSGAGEEYAVRRRQWARAGRESVQRQSVRDALDALRRALLGLPPLPPRP